MFLNRFTRTLAIAVSLIWMLNGHARCQDSSVAPPSSFKLKLERLPLRCNPPLYRAFVTAETAKFTFLLPPGFRIKGDCEARIKLSNLEGNCQITFAVLDPSPCDTQTLNADAYRDLVQTRYPKGRIIEQLCPGAAGHDGVGFDMRWETTNKFAQCTRTAFVPSALGLLEFTATSSPNDFTGLRYELNQVMATFQAVTPEGKFEIPPISPSDSDRSDAGSFFRKSQPQTFLAALRWRSAASPQIGRF